MQACVRSGLKSRPAPQNAKTGDKVIGLTARILLIASAGSVNGQPASNEKRT